MLSTQLPCCPTPVLPSQLCATTFPTLHCCLPNSMASSPPARCASPAPSHSLRIPFQPSPLLTVKLCQPDIMPLSLLWLEDGKRSQTLNASGPTGLHCLRTFQQAL